MFKKTNKKINQTTKPKSTEANRAMSLQDGQVKGVLLWKNVAVLRIELVLLISCSNLSGWIGYVGLLNRET